MRALLALEDGALFHGRSFGAPIDAGGEVVFNTSMTGYQEILTDPSYHHQIVVFTATQIGNYGIHEDDAESIRPRAAGMVVREASGEACHPHAVRDLPSYLRDHGCFGLEGVDTRALTLHLRSRGTLRGWLTSRVEDTEAAVRAARAVPRMEEVSAIEAVTSAAPWRWEGPASAGPPGERSQTARSAAASARTLLDATPRDGARPRIAVLDCGVKFGILRELTARGCDPIVLPSETSTGAIHDLSPDGVLLSNGPGDPASLEAWLPRITWILEHYPTLAICLGHQIASLSLGCRTVKLPFGHHGGNHPVQEIASGRVWITAQNHNYAVDPSSLPRDLAVTHRNLNDQTIEGVRHESLPLWSVQFHPEASPGPHDATAIFDDFAAALLGDPASRRTPSAAARRTPFPSAAAGHIPSAGARHGSSAAASSPASLSHRPNARRPPEGA